MVLHEVEVQMTGMDTAAYSSGDQVGVLQTITGVGPGAKSGCKLRQITVVDRAKQSAALQVLLFDASPTVASSNNGAIDVADAEMIDKCQAVVKVASADYVALNGNSVATVVGEYRVKPAADGTIYILLATTGTPTYGAATDLYLRLVFEWD